MPPSLSLFSYFISRKPCFKISNTRITLDVARMAFIAGSKARLYVSLNRNRGPSSQYLTNARDLFLQLLGHHFHPLEIVLFTTPTAQTGLWLVVKVLQRLSPNHMSNCMFSVMCNASLWNSLANLDVGYRCGEDQLSWSAPNVLK